MAKSDNLRRASKEKNDEFYTQLVDIEKEIKHYKDYFKNKTVFCNCDDPFESNFFKYFAMNFNHLGLKKLICTCYRQSPVAWAQLSLFENEHVIVKTEGGRDPYKIEINEVADYNGDGAVDLADVRWLLQNSKNSLSVLKGDGDFRSEECIELLKEADIVVTNPPFSLFREYMAQLIEHKKQFIIIGNQNAITYKDIFNLIKSNMVWLGHNAGAQTFLVPNSFERSNTYIENGKKYAKFGNICWFTNFDTIKRHENFTLYKKYTPNEYLKFDNYDAINIDKISDIPYDYEGAMGVPITFLDKYNPNQFEILGYTAKDMGVECLKFYTDLEQSLDGQPFIRNMKSARFSPMISHQNRPNGTCYRASNTQGYLTKTYGRIIIRRKQQ